MRYVNGFRQPVGAMRAAVVIACFFFCAMPPADAQTAEAPALGSLVERFFAAYQKEEIGDLLLMWSKESPDLAADEQALRRTFVENEQIRLSSLTVLDLKIEGDKAHARLFIDLSAIEVKTGKAAAGFGKMRRTLHFAREGGEWKIRRYVSGEEELAVELVEAKTEVARRALLEERAESVNAELVTALTGRARALIARGEFPLALEVLDLTAKIAGQLGDKAGVATAVRLTGNIHSARGDYQQAFESYRRSLELAGEIGDKTGVAGTLNNLGIVYDKVGDSERALEHYERCLSLASEIKHPQIITLALNNLGDYYRTQGDSLRALGYFQRSLKLAEELQDEAEAARALFNIGAVHQVQENYPQALAFYQRALAIHEKLGVRTTLPRTLSNIGFLYFRQDNYTLALDYYQKALKRGEELGDKEVIGNSFNNIGKVYGAQGNYVKALEYFRRGLEVAEATGNRRLATIMWRDLGEVHLRLGEYRKAIEHADRSAALALQSNLQSTLWEARTIAGKAHHALNQFDLARRSLLDAISTVEQLRERVAGGEQDQARSFEHRVEPYHAMVDLLLSRDDDYQALTYSERAKSRVLGDVLSSGRVNITKAMTAEERERERALNNEMVALNRQLYQQKALPQPDPSRLADLNARLQKARLEHEAFQTALYAAHSELRLQRGQAPSLSPGQLAELLPDANTAMLEFVVGDEATTLFVLTRGQDRKLRGEIELKTYRLGVKGKDLAARVRDFRQRLAGRNLEFRESARQLYDLLLQPAQAQLRGKSLLCIIPDGDLWELPFQALQPRDDSYLIEEHALFYAPSLAVLHGIARLSEAGGPVPTRRAEATAARRRVGVKGTLAAIPQSAPVLLAFGNPAIDPEAEPAKLTMRDERLVPLPEAEREVNKLKEIYHPSGSRVYIGADAREKVAKAEMGNYNVLHFAAHGVLDDANPMYSHLVMSQTGEADGEDGLLQAWEIMRLDLKADMVVLSACQTARGRLGRGEGVVGISWALFVAGSPTTVVSQWSVESFSTTQLMVEFHRNLLTRNVTGQPGLSKAEALRRASLSVLKNSRHAHPFYWAGFIMVGDGLRPL